MALLWFVLAAGLSITYLYIHSYIYTHLSTYMLTNICVYLIYTSLTTYIHTCICASMYIHTHPATVINGSQTCPPIAYTTTTTATTCSHNHHNHHILQTLQAAPLFRCGMSLLERAIAVRVQDLSVDADTVTHYRQLQDKMRRTRSGSLCFG